MCDILRNIAPLSANISTLCVEHIPEQTPPLEQKAAIPALIRYVWSWKIGRLFRIVLRVLSLIAVVIATPARAAYVQVQWLVAVAEGPRALVISLLQKVLIYVGV